MKHQTVTRHRVAHPTTCIGCRKAQPLHLDNQLPEIQALAGICLDGREYGNGCRLYAESDPQ